MTLSPLLKSIQHSAHSAWIDGAWSATSGTPQASVNPASGAVLLGWQEAGPQDIERAVQAAKKAQPAWATATGAERARPLAAAANLLRQQAADWALLETLDTGKPLRESLTSDVPSAAEACTWAAALAQTMAGTHHQLGEDFFYTRREPHGVCAAIGAWNYPLQIACWKSAPALACGNAIVMKPSEHTVLAALLLGNLLKQAGLPNGLYNVVCGASATAEALIHHPQVNKISLTGSTATGKRILAMTAPRIVPVTMELGGKSPLLVFADADIPRAITAAMQANFYTQGEVCSNASRILVERSVYAEFMQGLARATTKLVIGEPGDANTQIGAMIHAEHAQRVLGYIQRARDAGLECHVGGDRANVPGCADGWFIQPTLFGCGQLGAAAADTLEICRDEVFGPVIVALPFDSEAEAIERANNTAYGLAAGVFTRSLARAHRVTALLQAGVCWVNAYNLTPVEMPFGGIGQSGYGRENGQAVLEAYTRLKSVYVSIDQKPLEF